MILNLFVTNLSHTGYACTRCGTGVIPVVTDKGFNIFLDAAPHPLGRYHIAFARGDHGEHLAHIPFPGGSPPVKVPLDEALLMWRLAGKRLWRIHRCTG